ncbi:universal stress protein [Actinomycetospora rhizophila]|uniref:Universal stress protein n=1 Tax=Actinomycetospora rhizophila TaxID=1416876 RepID=A0ABV9ZDX9_9PSEU
MPRGLGADHLRGARPPPDWEEQAQDTLTAEQREVESALADLPGPWTYRTARGDPVTLLRRVADDHDALLIVVGSRGEGAGSVLSRLLGRAPRCRTD